MLSQYRATRNLLAWSILFWALMLVAPAQEHQSGAHRDHATGQHPATGQVGHAGHHDHAEMGDHHHSAMAVAGLDHSAHGNMNAAGMFLMGQSSGTGFNPAAWPMPMLMTRAGSWDLMWMGQAHVAGTHQSGPRGATQAFSANWGMLGAIHRVGRGSVMLRSMLSLDPLTVRGRYYPLLFQTGETAFGRPIEDGQHPHEFVMEVSAHYARALSERSVFNIYYAPVGDAPLGPVAYPHRASAMDMPQATLAHHWQDSTHIANQVLSAGISLGPMRLEAGGFHGAEPDEHRWNIDYGPIDSWAARLSFFPTRRWMGQVSMGRLHNPEAFHDDDVVRMTASAHYVAPRRGGNSWANSFIWARNYKTIERLATHAVVAETTYPVRRRNFLTGRFEWSQRDELFAGDHHLQHELRDETGMRAFNIGAYTAGYIRDFDLFRNVQTGIGGNFTVHTLPDVLKPYYGNRPYGLNLFLRVRLKASE
jgi:hypothetical protein